MDQMAEMFVKDYPYLKPNRRAVGGYARRNGYTRLCQIENGKQVYFYVKNEHVKK